ncbi:L-seryl-tRNA(Sec) kinase-like [Brienomyrus brachyistius]|uniref:L-seryl-tRNA(Sec) kinase-like n=1 Tax=Brienomyrus brachyistius TaxID=42636 RepID=UPI0020B1ED32|nr:L-seryl-tRNA(Sec) kinase-like [Brienomyrus brachyistius]
MEALAKPVSSENARTCLCVLCGLPAAGKSTLVQVLSECLRKRGWGCCVLCYDDLIPDEAYELRLAETDELSHGQTHWKMSRREVLQRLEQLLKRDHASSRAPEPSFGEKDTWTRFLRAAHEAAESSSHLPHDPATLVILLDDNFYYQSMRYEVYQLARKHSLAFCQLHVHCPVNSCLSRNRARSRPLPDEVVAEMAKRMEPPNPVRNGWEQRSLTLTSDRAFSPQVVELSVGLIAAAMDNPLCPIQDDAEQKEADRLGCASSVVHQADQACRRLVSQAMQGARERKVPPESMKSLAAELNQLKTRFLDDLRKAALCGHPTSPGGSEAATAFERETSDCIKRYSRENTELS